VISEILKLISAGDNPCSRRSSLNRYLTVAVKDFIVVKVEADMVTVLPQLPLFDDPMRLGKTEIENHLPLGDT